MNQRILELIKEKLTNKEIIETILKEFDFKINKKRIAKLRLRKIRPRIRMKPVRVSIPESKIKIHTDDRWTIK